MAARWLREGTLSTLDQAWVSAMSFAVSALFIGWGSKDEYAVYVLLFTVASLAQGVQTALFLLPYATIFPTQQADARRATTQVFGWGQVLFVALAALAGLVGLLGYQAATAGHLDVPLAGSFALAITGLSAREAVRSFHFVGTRPGSALAGDLAYGLVMLAALGWSLATGSLTAPRMLLITGLAGLLPLLGVARRGASLRPSLTRPDLARFWSFGRWSLTSTVLSWVNTNVYPYVAAASFGLAAVADMNAARLPLTPLVLMFPAWTNVMRPRFSAWHAEGRHARMRRVSAQSIVGGTALFALYAAALALAYPWVESRLRTDYRGLSPLIIAWAAFFFVSLLRTVLVSTLLVTEAGYRSLTRLSLLSVVMLGPVLWLSSTRTAVHLVAGLTLIEFAQLVWMLFVANASWRGGAAPGLAPNGGAPR